VFDSGLSELSLSYSGEVGTTLLNNGYAVQLSFDDAHTITGGPLGETSYSLSHIEFHWGDSDSTGSEHFIDGEQHALEAQFVHYKTSYANLTEALNHSDGVTILSVLFKTGVANAEIEKVTASMSGVVTNGNSASISAAVNPSAILPSDLSFYTYSGSLTAPACSEVVTWIVVSNVRTVSNSQLTAFRTAQFSSTKLIESNYRPIQPTNGRLVRTNNVDIVVAAAAAAEERYEKEEVDTGPIIAAMFFIGCVFAMILMYISTGGKINGSHYSVLMKWDSM